MAKLITGLVFEGGGIKGLAYVGALKVLDHAGILKGIVRVGGASAGAITAYLLALGYDPLEIEHQVASAPFDQFKDARTLRVISNTWRMFCHYGLYPGHIIENWLGECAAARGHNIFQTFWDLAKRKVGPALYTVAHNVNWGCYEVMSAESTPDISVVKAVRASMAIPFAFTPVEIDGDWYVDGGTTMNFPVRMFDFRQYLSDPMKIRQAPWSTDPADVYNNEVVGFRIDDPAEIAARACDTGIVSPGRLEIKNILGFAKALSGQLWQAANALPLHSMDWERTVVINSVGIPTLKFNLTKSEQYELERQGSEATLRWLRK